MDRLQLCLFHVSFDHALLQEASLYYLYQPQMFLQKGKSRIAVTHIVTKA
jgi:hypothetical protein